MRLEKKYVHESKTKVMSQLVRLRPVKETFSQKTGAENAA